MKPTIAANDLLGLVNNIIIYNGDESERALNFPQLKNVWVNYGPSNLCHSTTIKKL